MMAQKGFINFFTKVVENEMHFLSAYTLFLSLMSLSTIYQLLEENAYINTGKTKLTSERLARLYARTKYPLNHKVLFFMSQSTALVM